MSTDLNMEYQEVKFGEIAKHISKRVEPSETTLEIYVGLEHLDPDSLKITRHGVPSDVAGQKLLVKKGQIIFGKRRAYQRKVAVADWDCICSAHAMVLEAIPGKILPEFLPFFMQSNQFMERAVEISEGSLSPTIKWKTLENQVFRIPILTEQNQILNIVKSVDQLCNRIDEAELSIVNLSEKIFEDFLENNNICFEEAPLKTYTNKITKGTTPSTIGYNFEENGVTYIKAESVTNDGNLIKNKLAYINSECHQQLMRSQLYEDDVLFSIAGVLGRTYVVKQDDLPANTNQAMAIIGVKKDKLIADYLNLQLNSKRIKEEISMKTVKAAQPNLSLTQIGLFTIKVPSIDDQMRIVKSMKILSEQLKTLEAKKITVQKIKSKFL